MYFPHEVDMPDERHDTYATMSDAAGQFHAQGLPCPYDCYRCDSANNSADPYADLVLTLACGHEDQSTLYGEDPHGDTVPPEAYCWPCQAVHPVTRSVVLMPIPYVPRKVSPSPWPEPDPSWDPDNPPF